MCGILGCKVKKMSMQVTKNLYDLFEDQKSRGTEGAGISINGKSLYRFRSFSPFRIFSVYNIELWKKIRSGDSVIFHHRYPTSTKNRPSCNHPIANEEGTIHVIHNGCLYDYMKAYDRLKAEHTFETTDKDDGGRFTDSEVIVHTFEDGLKENDGDVKKALSYTYKAINGSFAVALVIKGDDAIYLMRHSNPILISKDEAGNFYFSSELSQANKSLTLEREMVQGEIGKLTPLGYTQLTIEKETYKQSKVFDYFRNRPAYEQTTFVERVILPEHVEELIEDSVKGIYKGRKHVNYDKLCLRVFADIDKTYPEIDITNHEIRIAIREKIDEVRR